MASEHHLTLEELTLLPGAEWSPTTGHWTLFRVASGTGYLMKPNSPCELSQDDAVGLPSTAKGVFRASILGIMRLQAFPVRVDLFGGLLTLRECCVLESVLQHPASGLRFFKADHAVAREFRRICESRVSRSALHQRFERLQLFMELFAKDLSEHSYLSEHSFERTKIMTSPDRFEKLMRELPRSELTSCSLSELAKKCGCSERHFGRMFKAHFGDSLRNKQAELRLERAAQLLLESDEMISRVALECGYQHLSLFNTMFKRRFGMTPSQWRRQDVSTRFHALRPSASFAAAAMLSCGSPCPSNGMATVPCTT